MSNKYKKFYNKRKINYDDVVNKEINRLIKMQIEVVDYDVKREQVEKIILSNNPVFKVPNIPSLSKTYNSKINDLVLLRYKFETKQISLSKYKRLIREKRREITSYRKELYQLRSNDGMVFASLIANSFKRALDYIYLVKLLENGAYEDLKDILGREPFFKDLPIKDQIRVVKDVFAPQLRELGWSEDEIKSVLKEYERISYEEKQD